MHDPRASLPTPDGAWQLPRPMETTRPTTAGARQRAWRFVVAIGIVSLCADFTYEGGWSISGPFLAVLGASALAVGAVAGVGEFLGYAVRLAAGRWVDRTGRPWTLVWVGYAVNVLVVPALALAPNAWVAAGLLFLERLGKGLRTPARDALLARAGGVVGVGKAFGTHELLDQFGAVLGPLAVAGLVTLGGGNYRWGFAGLLPTAVAALGVLAWARWREPATREPHEEGPLPWLYGAYLVFAVATVVGFAPFALVGYHWQTTGRAVGALVPLFFAVAMAADAVVAYGAGHAFDRIGLRVLVAQPALAAAAMPLLFLGRGTAALVGGAALWGAAMGLQESVMRSAVATLAPSGRRGTAYGAFDAAYGVAWLVGGVMLGALYRWGPMAVVTAALAAQAMAVGLLARLLRGAR